MRHSLCNFSFLFMFFMFLFSCSPDSPWQAPSDFPRVQEIKLLSASQTQVNLWVLVSNLKDHPVLLYRSKGQSWDSIPLELTNTLLFFSSSFSNINNPTILELLVTNDSGGGFYSQVPLKNSSGQWALGRTSFYELNGLRQVVHAGNSFLLHGEPDASEVLLLHFTNFSPASISVHLSETIEFLSEYPTESSATPVISGTLLIPQVQFVSLIHSLSTVSQTLVDYGEYPTNWKIGQTVRTFISHDFSGGGQFNVDAVLMAVGTNLTALDGSGNKVHENAFAYIFVETNWAASVTAEDLKIISSAFNGENGIYRKLTALSGYEYGGGTNGNGGIDANRNVILLLEDIRDGYTGKEGHRASVGGYYWSANDLGYNGAQMVYLDISPNLILPVGNEHRPWRVVSILAHEFHHMILQNQKTFRDGAGGGVYESTWLNEACSQAAEDLLSSGFPVQYRVSSVRLPYYLERPGVSLSDWSSNLDKVLYNYATAWSFLAFAMRHSSPLLLREIVKGAGRNNTGWSAVNESLKVLGSENIDSLYLDWRESPFELSDNAVFGYGELNTAGFDLPELSISNVFEKQGSSFETLSPGDFNLSFKPLSMLIFHSIDGKTSRIEFSGNVTGLVAHQLKERKPSTNVVLNPDQLFGFIH